MAPPAYTYSTIYNNREKYNRAQQQLLHVALARSLRRRELRRLTRVDLFVLLALQPEIRTGGWPRIWVHSKALIGTFSRTARSNCSVNLQNFGSTLWTLPFRRPLLDEARQGRKAAHPEPKAEARGHDPHVDTLLLGRLAAAAENLKFTGLTQNRGQLLRSSTQDWIPPNHFFFLAGPKSGLKVIITLSIF